MITFVTSPDIVDRAISHVSASWSVHAYERAAASLDGMLPPQLKRAAPKRRAEHLAGRLCAARALGQAGCLDVGPIGSDANRCPLWPEGFVGSITHTTGYAAAAVAKAEDRRAIGIDSEGVLDQRAAGDVRKLVLSKGTAETVAGKRCMHGLSEAQWLTLLFSAKESVYKCINPITRKRLAFHDLELIEIDGKGGTIDLRLLRDAGADFGCGTSFTLRWVLSDLLIHTALELMR